MDASNANRSTEQLALSQRRDTHQQAFARLLVEGRTW